MTDQITPEQALRFVEFKSNEHGWWYVAYVSGLPKYLLLKRRYGKNWEFTETPEEDNQ